MQSRRTFLKLFGIAAAAVALPLPQSLFNIDLRAGSQGRTLEAVNVFSRPDVKAVVVNQLWPDSIVDILGSRAGWYRVAGGFVPGAGIQPMVRYRADESAYVTGQTFLVEVAAPAASIRAACAADAALVTRIGHGGVATVMDALPGEPSGWYGIADSQGAFLGWSPANRWRAVPSALQDYEAGRGGEDRVLQVDMARGQLMALEQGKAILQTACSVGQAMPTGQYTLQGQRASATSLAYQGVPWQTMFGDELTVAGAYWHNRFGEAVAGPTVQVAPLTAQWIYGWVGQNSTLEVLST